MVKLTNMENEKMNTNKTNERIISNSILSETCFATKYNTCVDIITVLREELDNTNNLKEKLENKIKENQEEYELFYTSNWNDDPNMASKDVDLYYQMEEKNEKLNLKITKLQLIADQVKSTLNSIDNVWKKLYIYNEAFEEAEIELN
tara:strand:- start:10099 stop:10539 length:441 start_codon:yes stop_codon:yes gene_type:complete